MIRDRDRMELVESQMAEHNLAAVVCTHPANVLMLSGYCPVLGASLAVAARDGRVHLLVPEDERSLAEQGWADAVHTYPAGSLTRLEDPVDRLREGLGQIAREMRLPRGGNVGFEDQPVLQPAQYVAIFMFGPALLELLRSALAGVQLVPAGEMLAQLRAILTPQETNRVRLACRIAAEAFREGADVLRPGLTETEAAALFRAPLLTRVPGNGHAQRADGSAWCATGAHAAQAFISYQRSRATKIGSHDLVLVHCNSFVDGFWTEITRTYCMGEPDERKRRMFEAVFAARAAALGVIEPEAQATAVDRAAREVMHSSGFGHAFKHAAGHGVGFAAIDHRARPRLHPASPDVLEVGMIFCLQPAVYLEGIGGVRHCDMVRVAENGAEVLTPFQARVEELVLSGIPA